MEYDDITTDKINLIIGQTDYSFDEAKQRLSACNNDEFIVIRNYLRGDAAVTIKSENLESKNQLIYKEIRNFMDGCSKK